MRDVRPATKDTTKSCRFQFNRQDSISYRRRQSHHRNHDFFLFSNLTEVSARNCSNSTKCRYLFFFYKTFIYFLVSKVFCKLEYLYTVTQNVVVFQGVYPQYYLISFVQTRLQVVSCSSSVRPTTVIIQFEDPGSRGKSPNSPISRNVSSF